MKLIEQNDLNEEEMKCSISEGDVSKQIASFGNHWSFNFRNDPKRLAFVLSRYKFAAKMACKGMSVLELGCSEGIGAPILAEHAEHYTGVDLDKPAIDTAKTNFQEPKYKFIFDDFMGRKYGAFDGVVSLDVVEHILPEFETIYFDTVVNNLSEKGICVIGTPNITSVPYASEYSQLGHVNMYSQERLANVLKKYFHYVFPFGMNDEIVHTGFAAMSHYIVCVCCYKK
ncbi:MAG: methyltransferase domain-containing protein [Chlamydiales bacterium]|nr:methyltransferase domain-containing protein [Chlamydiales bacterium]